MPKIFKNSIERSKLFKAGGYLVSQNIVASLATLVIAYFAANYLDPEVYGTYKYILSVAAMAMVFSLSGAGNTLLRATARGDHLLPFLFKKSVTYGLAATVVLLGIAGYYFYQENNVLSLSFFLAGLLQPLLHSFKLYSAFLNGLQEYQTLAKYTVLSNAVVMIVLSTVMFVVNQPVAIVAVYFLAHVGTAAVAYYASLRFHKKESSHESQHKELRFSQHLSVMEILNKIANKLDLILAFQFLGPANLAQYAFALTPINQIKGQNKILRSLLAPRFSKYQGKAILATVHTKALLHFLLVLLLTITYWVLAPFIFAILFPLYEDAVFYTQLLSLGLLTMPIVFYGEYLLSQQKKKELYIIKILTPLLRIILLVILVYLFGLLGLVLSFVIPRFFHVVLTVFLVYKN